ncbi:MAG TPA: carbohydrate kinase family protein [Anaerolineae bacterium]
MPLSIPDPRSQIPGPRSQIPHPTSHIPPPGPIIAIGDLAADLIVSIPRLPVEAGQHQLADAIELEPGGGANFLIAGARLGYPMAAIGALGADTWGQQVADLMQAENVDLSAVAFEGTTTQVVVLVDHRGEHVFLGKYGQGGKISLGLAEVGLIKKGTAIYCAGYSLNETRLIELTLEAMRLARQSGVPVFFDPGPQMAGLSAGLRQQVLPLIDTLLLTEEEIPLLTSGPVTDLIKTGPQTIVVKRGSKGCTIYTQADQPPLEAPAYPVTVVDTAAAGDSFNAAFIVGTLWGWSLPDCARLANAVGAAKVKKLGGGRNVPTLSDVRDIITEFQIGLVI